MPSYTDPSTGKRIRSDEPLSDADLEEAFGGGAGVGAAVSAGPNTAPAVSPPEEGGALSRAASYVTKRVSEYGGALKRLASPTPAPPKGAPWPGYELGQFGQAASDVLSIGGAIPLPGAPVLQPVLTAAGTAAGAALRGAGASEGTAELADIGLQVASGVGYGGYRGLKAGKEALDVIPEGEKIRQAAPGIWKKTAAARSQLFDPIMEKLSATGRTIKAGTPEGERLGQALMDAQADWGQFAKVKETRVLEEVLGKLTSGAGEITAKELDDSLHVLNTIPKTFAARRAIVGGLDDLAKGTPLEGQLTAAGKEYHKTIAPGIYLAKRLSGGAAQTPGGAAQVAATTWGKLSKATKAMVDPTGEIDAIVKAGTQGQSWAGVGAIGVGVGVGVGAAVNDFMNGDYKGGFTKLFITAPGAAALRYPGVAKAVVGGAAPGVAAGVTGPAGRMLGGGTKDRTDLQLDSGAETAVQGGAGPVEAGRVGYPSPAFDNEKPETRSATPAEVPPPPQSPKGARGVAPRVSGPYGRELEAVGKVVDIDPMLLAAVMRQESGGDASAVSRPGASQVQTPARGLFQVTVGTFHGIKDRVEQLTGRPASIDDPLDNIVAGALLYRKYLDQTGDVAAAARLYHGGENLAYHGPLTKRYGEDVARRYSGAEQEEGSGGGLYSYKPREQQNARPSTVKALQWVASQWAKRYPESPLPIGDLDAPGHLSHKKGVDVDIGIPRTDGFRERGHAKTRFNSKGAISDEQQQELIELLHSNPIAPVEVIGFDNPNVAGVHEWGSKGYGDHGNHFHVRFRG